MGAAVGLSIVDAMETKDNESGPAPPEQTVGPPAVSEHCLKESQKVWTIFKQRTEKRKNLMSVESACCILSQGLFEWVDTIRCAAVGSSESSERGIECLEAQKVLLQGMDFLPADFVEKECDILDQSVTWLKL